MNREEPNPASAKEQAEGSGENLKRSPDRRRLEPDHDSDVNGLNGKTDSGPEPDIFGREIPPQD
jgi:hypothetical protein